MTAAKERGLMTRLSPPQATHVQGGGLSGTTVRPEWSNRVLQVNLILCNATVWIMFVVAGVVMAFALLAMDELRYEYISFFVLVGCTQADTPSSDDDLNCSSSYISEPDELWLGDEQARNRYHSQCRLLYSWTYILTVACSFSLVRTLLLAIPVRNPT